MYINYYGYLIADFVKLFDIRQFHCCEYCFIPMEAFYVSIYSIVDRMGE